MAWHIADERLRSPLIFSLLHIISPCGLGNRRTDGRLCQRAHPSLHIRELAYEALHYLKEERGMARLHLVDDFRALKRSTGFSGELLVRAAHVAKRFAARASSNPIARPEVSR